MSLRLRLYVLAVALAAAALLALGAPQDLESRWAQYATWAAICLACERLSLKTLSGTSTVTMASTAGLAAAMLWGQGASMWIVATSTLVADLFLIRKPWVRAVFNSSQSALTMWAATGTWALLGGPGTGLERLALPAGEGTAARLLGPMLGLFVVYLLVNRALVSLAVSWSTERPYLKVLRQDWFFTERLLNDAAAFLLAPLMVISFRAIGYVGLLLFYSPLQIIYESYRRYLELQSAQEQMIHTERMAAKGEMAAEVGHELRNQLVAISGRAQLIMKDAERGTFANVPRHAQIVLEQAKRMEALSNGLMDFSRAQLTMERTDLNALIQRSIEFVRTQNRFDGVEWDLKFADPTPEPKIDPGQIQQVLLNLFMNAADAMNERNNGRKAIMVYTQSEPRGKQVTITVTDTGSGIVASNLTRIFEPHFTTKANGHGFGLSTSYRIIHQHGGRITAESPPGEGARFTIVLPVTGPADWS